MIYLVEDDDSIRELVIYTLRSTGMDAKGFGLPSEFWHAMEEQLPELVLLDIMLPEEDGLEILRKIRGRRETKSLPVIMLTAKGTEYDQVVGLDNGADDYVAKPFGMMALVARIKAVLRRTAEKSAEGKVLQLGELRVDPVRHVVQAAGAGEPDPERIRTALPAAGQSGCRLYPRPAAEPDLGLFVRRRKPYR